MLERVLIGLGYGASSAAAHAAGGAACSAAGAGILAAAHHTGYHAAAQAASGAAGGAILSGGAALIVGLVAPETVALRLRGSTSITRPLTLELVLGVSSMVLAGMVGAAVLRAAGHDNAPATGQAAAASAVGAAVISGGSLVLSLLLCAPARRQVGVSEV